jgi:hypothetical protein
MRRGVGVLFVAFLAARIFLSPPAAPLNSPAPAQQTKAFLPRTLPSKQSANTAPAVTPAPVAVDPCKTKSGKCPPKGLIDAINTALGTPSSDLDLTKRWQISAENAKNAHFLIATVPNPVHTHLSLLFDRQIVAIEEAVQQGGYLFTRAYLPWDSIQHVENSDFRTRLQEQDYQDARENYPGVLLFHYRENQTSGKTETQPLLVFLVAETPTGGIDKEQFNNAISAMQEICGARCAVPLPAGGKNDLYILGPTFSGSFYSLRDILVQQARKFASVTIHSGTATDYDTIQWFRDWWQKDFPALNIIFRPFEESSTYALDHLLSFVCREGYRSGQLAVLSEDETAYGSGNFGETNLSENQASSNKGACPNDPSGPFLHLYFPRDISALRNAYQEDLKVSGTSSNSGAPRSTLTLNLEDHGNNDDSVPSFAQDQTPLSDEATMMAIVSDLREHGTNLVVIEATNPVDTVFLVRYLRLAYSEARILTVGSDLLLPRQVDDPRLRGVMQITSYSLIPEIDHFTTPGRCGQSPDLNRVFPSDYSVGTFNALLSLMQVQGSALNLCSLEAPSGKMNGLGQVSDLRSEAFVQFGWPKLAGRGNSDKALVPPLWLTILGRDQFWPVELLDGSETNTARDKTPSILHAISSDAPKDFNPLSGLPPSWIVVCALGVAFALSYALLALNGTIYSASAFLANFAPVKDRWRNLTLVLCGVVIFDILICLLWPEFWFPGRTKWPVVTVVGFACLLIVYDLHRRGRWRLAASALLLGGVSMEILDIAFGQGSESLHNFMRYRYANVTSGVSPFVPFLFLFVACLWSCWHSLSGRPPWDRAGTGPRLPLNADVILEADYSGESPADRQRLSALTKEGNFHLLNAMKPGKLNRRIWIPTFVTWVILVLSGVVPAWPHRIQTFEGKGYDNIYTMFVILIAFVLLTDAFRLGLIWLELRRLLMALDRLPLRRGFARMAGFSSKRLWQLGGSTFEDYFAILSKEIQTITALSNSAVGTDVPDDLRRTSADVAQFASWIQHIPKEKMKGASLTHTLCEGLHDMQVKLAGTCSAILRELNVAWNDETRPVWDAECIASEKSKGTEFELPPAVRLKEDFVCLFYLNFISSVFTRMRSLVLSISGLYVFVLLSFGSYPFEPSSMFHTAMVFLLIFIAVIVGVVYGQAHKDATLSRITNTNAGELGYEFWLRLAGFVAVPLLSLLAAKFPEIGGFLFSWLEPASQAFR